MEEIHVGVNILGKNDEIAAKNKKFFEDKNLFAMNVMSSPGAGKTTFLIETIKRISDRYRVGVIEGDVATHIDAERIKTAGAPVVQINTGGACHLDASMVSRAMSHLPIDELDVLIIENVGNLVCPAEWKLGEHMKVTILSIPEGDDKPAKYPLMFSEADVVVLNKIDLLPYFNFDVEGVEKVIRGLNPDVTILRLSSTTFEGFDSWIELLISRIEEVRS